LTKSLFLAGASGAVGRRLAPLLVAEGWRVIGATRFSDKADLLRRLGVEPVVVDVYDGDALRAAVAQARPRVVIHQLTDLPPALDPARMPEGLIRNARIREQGTRNLVAAAVDAGAERLIAQSIAFAYADGPRPHREHDPLTSPSVVSLERQVHEAPLAGVVLRYGRLYGPGTGFEKASGPAPVHVDAAAKAAELAVTGGSPGIYNIAEDDGAVSSEKARRELGWDADWRAAA
jgi:nucleoside-diphosphate-sugar epimerase